MLIAAVSIFFLSQRAPGPEEIRDQYFSCLKRQDWACLYQLAPESERKWTGVSETQFVQLCKGIATRIPKEHLQDFTWRYSGAVNPNSDRLYRIEFTNYFAAVPEKDRPSAASGFGSLFLRRGPTGWCTLASPLPFTLLGLNPDIKGKRAGYLADQLEAVGLSEWRTFENRMGYPVSSLRAFQSGKMNWNQVGKPLPR